MAKRKMRGSKEAIPASSKRWAPFGKARNLSVTGGTITSPKIAEAPGISEAAISIDLTETIKTLLHLAQEQGRLTYEDINDVLPEGVSPEAMDELYTKLRALDVEIVDRAEVEKVKPAEVEEETDNRDTLDDPVRMYMNQMGKVPLLTREQEVEVCKRIESAESEATELIYSLGFTAKEHCAIAEKLLCEPPKERFDRVIADKKVASREGHLKELRRLLKKIQALDTEVDEQYAAWQKASTTARREHL